jgi:hypothetical protein
LQAGKSSATLHACDTAPPAMVEGLLWTAIAAAALTRFLAPMPPLSVQGPIATRQVAMGATHVCGDVGEALKTGNVTRLLKALEQEPYAMCDAMIDKLNQLAQTCASMPISLRRNRRY